MLHKELYLEVDDVSAFLRSIAPEESNLNASRFRWSSEEKDKGVVFHLNADDATALKAAESSVTRLWTVFKKIEKMS